MSIFFIFIFLARISILNATSFTSPGYFSVFYGPSGFMTPQGFCPSCKALTAGAAFENKACQIDETTLQAGCCLCDPNANIITVQGICDSSNICYGNDNNYRMDDEVYYFSKCVKECPLSPDLYVIGPGYYFYGEDCMYMSDCSGDYETTGDLCERCICANGNFLYSSTYNWNSKYDTSCVASCPADDADTKKYYFNKADKSCYENSCLLGLDKRISYRIIPTFYYDLYLHPARGTYKGECQLTCKGHNVVNMDGECLCAANYVWDPSGTFCMPALLCKSEGRFIDESGRLCLDNCTRTLIDHINTSDTYTNPDGYIREGNVYSKRLTIDSTSTNYCMKTCPFGFFDDQGICTLQPDLYLKTSLQKSSLSTGNRQPLEIDPNADICNCDDIGEFEAFHPTKYFKFCTPCNSFSPYEAVYKSYVYDKRCYTKSQTCKIESCAFNENPIDVGGKCGCPPKSPYYIVGTVEDTCSEICDGNQGRIADANNRCYICEKHVSLDLSKCIDACPDSTSSVTYLSIKYCRCPTGKYYSNFLSNCLTPDTCSALGSSFSWYFETDTSRPVCASYCPENLLQIKYRFSRTCVTLTNCAAYDAIKRGNKCICPMTLPIWDQTVLKCVATVPSGKRVEEGFIIGTCSAGYYRSFDGVSCVSNCSVAHQGAQNPGSADDMCVCPNSEKFSRLSNKCISTCNRVVAADKYTEGDFCETSKICSKAGDKISADLSSCVPSCGANEFESNAICVACTGADTNMKIYAGTQCLNACPENTNAVSYGATCECAYDKYRNVDGSCAVNCGRDLIPEFGNVCKKACDGGYVSSDTTHCLQKCPPGQKYDSEVSGSCFASCPGATPYMDLKSEKCIGSCSKDDYSLNPATSSIQCIYTCPSGQIALSGRCVVCSGFHCCDPQYQNIDGSCSASCIQDVRSWFSHSATLTCSNFCQNTVNEAGTTCITSCGTASQKVAIYPKNTCLSSCHSPGAPFFDLYKSHDSISCLAFCGAGLKVSSNTCSSGCASNEKLDFEKRLCNSTCESTDPFNQYLSTSNTDCIPYCDGKNNNKYLNSDGNACIPTCDPTSSTNKYISPDFKSCLTSCTFYNEALTNCLNECPDGTFILTDSFSKNICVSSCLNYSKFIATDGASCVDSCSLYSNDNLRCLLSCNGAYGNSVLSGDHCLRSCEDSDLSYKIGLTLGAHCSCKDSHPIKSLLTGEGPCLDSCPSGNIISVNYTCIAACGTPPDTYMSYDDNRCVSDCGGYPYYNPPNAGQKCLLCLESWNSRLCKSSCTADLNGYASSSNSLNCVKSCEGLSNNSYYSNDPNTCIASCGGDPNNRYISIDGKSCKPNCGEARISWDDIRCVASCDGTNNNNYESIDKTKCYKVCPLEQYISYTGKACIISCSSENSLLDSSDGLSKVCTRSCDGSRGKNFVTSGNKCLESCSEPELSFKLPNNVCVASCVAITGQTSEPIPGTGICECPNNLYFNEDFTSCIPFNPTTTEGKYMHINGIQLIPDCSYIFGHLGAGKFIAPYNKICNCKLISKDKTKCLEYCPPGQYKSLKSYILLGVPMSICSEDCTKTANSSSQKDFFDENNCYCKDFKFYDPRSDICFPPFKCPVGFYHEYKNYTCMACSLTCEECKYGNSDTQCIKCKIGYFLFEGKCDSACDTNLGVFEDNFNRVCSPCHKSCLKCSGPSSNECIECKRNSYILPNNTCVSSSLCPQRTWADFVKQSCVECNQNCESCDLSVENCTNCREGYFLYLEKCISQCPVGFFKNSTNRKCEFCSTICQSCNESNPNTCLSCNNGSYLYQGSCIKRCPFKTFADSIDHSCKNCSSGCTTCYGNQSQNCLSCISPKNLDKTSSSCVTDCPSGTFRKSGICFPCHHMCKECTGGLKSDCTRCQKNYVFNNNECLLNCPSSYYLSGETCLSCNKNCADCDGPLSKNCLTCLDPYFKLNNTCLDKSLSFFCNYTLGFYSPLHNTCEPCVSSCSRCAESASQCTSCIPNLIEFDSDMKVCKFRNADGCEQGSYRFNKSENSFSCEPCDAIWPNSLSCDLKNIFKCNKDYCLTNFVNQTQECVENNYLSNKNLVRERGLSTCKECSDSIGNCSSCDGFMCTSCVDGFFPAFNGKDIDCLDCKEKFPNSYLCTNKSIIECSPRYYLDDYSIENDTFLQCLPCNKDSDLLYKDSICYHCKNPYKKLEDMDFKCKELEKVFSDIKSTINETNFFEDTEKVNKTMENIITVLDDKTNVLTENKTSIILSFTEKVVKEDKLIKNNDKLQTTVGLLEKVILNSIGGENEELAMDNYIKTLNLTVILKSVLEEIVSLDFASKNLTKRLFFARKNIINNLTKYFDKMNHTYEFTNMDMSLEKMSENIFIANSDNNLDKIIISNNSLAVINNGYSVVQNWQKPFNPFHLIEEETNEKFVFDILTVEFYKKINGNYYKNLIDTNDSNSFLQWKLENSSIYLKCIYFDQDFKWKEVKNTVLKDNYFRCPLNSPNATDYGVIVGFPNNPDSDQIKIILISVFVPTSIAIIIFILVLFYIKNKRSTPNKYVTVDLNLKV